MTDISVIILAGQEKLHMRRCLERLTPLEPRDVFVITSQPDDGTEAIAREMGAKVVFHSWPGLHAKQFNWALDNCPITTRWVLRLDADEYLYLDTVEEVKSLIGEGEESCGLSADVTSLSLSRACVLWRKDPFWRNGAHLDGAILQVRHRSL